MLTYRIGDGDQFFYRAPIVIGSRETSYLPGKLKELIPVILEGVDVDAKCLTGCLVCEWYGFNPLYESPAPVLSSLRIFRRKLDPIEAKK